MDYVLENHGHYEAEELLIDIRKSKKRVSGGTIYRTLVLLVKCGLIRKVVFGEKHAYYEHVFDYEHHDHLVCSKCGSVIEFTDVRIEKYKDDICFKNKFKAKSHELLVMGFCEDCGIK